MAIEIVTSSDLRAFVRDLIKRHSLTERTMGEYLRALWAEVLRHKDDVVTFALLAHLIKAAYIIEPLPFDSNWLQVKQFGWTWDKDSKSHVSRGFDEKTIKWVIVERNIDPFRILKHTILAQISERYLLENAPNCLAEDERERLRNDWSNPDPYPYLERAMDMYGESEDQTEKPQVLDWAELAAILSIGKVYD